MERVGIKVVALCPVKNEEWIIDNFIRTTKIWADHIIIADQNSDDKTVEICKRYDDVTVIRNDSKELDEHYRQSILIDEARKKFVGYKIIMVALDADELLSYDFAKSSEWKEFLGNAPPGSVLLARGVNIFPNQKEYWDGGLIPFAYVDDGRPHTGGKIHSFRLPIYPDTNKFLSESIKILHLQYIDWNRMLSKHRWYLVIEWLENNAENFIYTERVYSHMHCIPFWKKRKLKDNWVHGYYNLGIDIFKYHVPQSYPWDLILQNYFNRNGASSLHHLNIWQGKFEGLINQKYFFKIVYMWTSKTNFLYHNFKVFRILLKISDMLIFKIAKRFACLS